MTIGQRTKFIVTEVREHISHDIHTVEDFIMRHFGDVPVPVNVKIEFESLGEILNIEPVAEPAAEPAPEPVVEPAPEPVAEPMVVVPTPAQDGQAPQPAAE